MEVFWTVFRLLLVLGHLLAFAVAITVILREDYALLVKKQIDPAAIKETSKTVFWGLLTLTITGAGIIWIDTGFDLAVLASKSKILAKLTVVGVLSLNGAVIHYLAFPAFKSRKSLLHFVPKLSVLAAISVVSWMYAAFVGIAKPLSSMLGYRGFIEVYVVLLVWGILLSLIVSRPLLSKLKVVYPTLGQKPEPVMKRLVNRVHKRGQMEAVTTVLYPM